MHKVLLEKPPVALKIANFFGAFGYMSLMLEWLWVFGLLLYPYIININFMLPDNTPEAPPTPPAAIDSTLALVLGAVVTVLCLAVAVYALYSVPRSIAKTGARAARLTANTVIPTMTHHRHVSKKESKRLTFAVVCYLKAAAIAIPLFACFIMPDTLPLSKQIVNIIAVFFAAWTTINFGVQFAIAKFAALNTDQIW